MPVRTENLRMAKRFAIFAGLWVVLTGGAAGGLVFGLAASAAAVWVSVRLAPPVERPLRLLRLLTLAPGFFLRAFRGGLDVAWRAFHPRLPLRPGWITYQSTLPSGAPRAVLGGEVSLTPGTLAAGEQDGRLLVHCLDINLPVARQIGKEEERLGTTVKP
jgi:multicomponent Na+:H+ antiporter subunit E